MFYGDFEDDVIGNNNNNSHDNEQDNVNDNGMQSLSNKLKGNETKEIEKSWCVKSNSLDGDWNVRRFSLDKKWPIR